MGAKLFISIAASIIVVYIIIILIINVSYFISRYILRTNKKSFSEFWEKIGPSLMMPAMIAILLCGIFSIISGVIFFTELFLSL